MANLQLKWKPLPSNNQYLISNYGGVKSVVKDKVLSGYSRRKVLKSGRVVNKERTVSFPVTLGEKSRTVLIHHLVAECFLPPRPSSDYTIDHIDRDPRNNRSDNLRWATVKQQTVNRIIIRKHNIKFTQEDINDFYRRSKTELIKNIAKSVGVTNVDMTILLKYMHPDY